MLPRSVSRRFITHTEVEYHIISEELRDSLKSGGPSGPIGAMEVDDIDLTMLNRAIPHAMDVEFVFENLQRLLMSAVLVKRLRTALKQNRWKIVSQLVKFTERKDFDLDKAVIEEVERARLEVVSRATLAELNIALANKNAAAVRYVRECVRARSASTIISIFHIMTITSITGTNLSGTRQEQSSQGERSSTEDNGSCSDLFGQTCRVQNGARTYCRGRQCGL